MHKTGLKILSNGQYSFSAFTLLVGRQERHLAPVTRHPIFSKKSFGAKMKAVMMMYPWGGGSSSSSNSRSNDIGSGRIRFMGLFSNFSFFQ